MFIASGWKRRQLLFRFYCLSARPVDAPIFMAAMPSVAAGTTKIRRRFVDPGLEALASAWPNVSANRLGALACGGGVGAGPGSLYAALPNSPAIQQGGRVP